MYTSPADRPITLTAFATDRVFGHPSRRGGDRRKMLAALTAAVGDISLACVLSLAALTVLYTALTGITPQTVVSAVWITGGLWVVAVAVHVAATRAPELS